MSKIRSYSEMFSIIRSVHDRFFLFTTSNLLEIMIWKAKKNMRVSFFLLRALAIWISTVGSETGGAWDLSGRDMSFVMFWNNKAREWRHDSGKTQANKLEWWMILKISLRAKVGVPKPLVKRKLRLHSLYFLQNTLMLRVSRINQWFAFYF